MLRSIHWHPYSQTFSFTFQNEHKWDLGEDVWDVLSEILLKYTEMALFWIIEDNCHICLVHLGVWCWKCGADSLISGVHLNVEKLMLIQHWCMFSLHSFLQTCNSILHVINLSGDLTYLLQKTWNIDSTKACLLMCFGVLILWLQNPSNRWSYCHPKLVEFVWQHKVFQPCRTDEKKSTQRRVQLVKQSPSRQKIGSNWNGEVWSPFKQHHHVWIKNCIHPSVFLY